MFASVVMVPFTRLLSLDMIVLLILLLMELASAESLLNFLDSDSGDPIGEADAFLFVLDLYIPDALFILCLEACVYNSNLE